MDFKTWWDSQNRYQINDRLHFVLKGRIEFNALFKNQRREGIWVRFDLDKEELDQLRTQLPTSFNISDDGYSLIPRRDTVDVNRADDLKKSDTPRMAKLKEEMRLKRGDTVDDAKQKLDVLLQKRAKPK
jgi:hypothetical protein